MTKIKKISQLPSIVGTVASNDFIPLSDRSANKTVKITVSQLIAGYTGFLSNTLTDSYIFVGNGSNEATGVPVSGDLTLANTGIATIGNNAISNAKIRQGVATSIIGRSANSTGNVADIAAVSDNTILKRASGALSFGTIVDAEIDAAASISITKLAIGTNDGTARVLTSLSGTNSWAQISNVHVATGAAILASKIGLLTGLTRTIGIIAATDTLLQGLSKAVSSNGDSFGATMKIGTNDASDLNLLCSGDVIFKVTENAGAYTPKYILIGDQAVSSAATNECMTVGTTSQETTVGIGIGLSLVNRITVSANDPTLIAIQQGDSIYNPGAYTMTGARLVGLRLGYDTTTSKAWELQFTRANGWEATEGDAGTVTAFADASAPTVYVGGNGTNNINYIMGDPASYIKVSVVTTTGTTVDRYVPAYSLTQLP